VDAEACHSIAWEYLRAGETQLALEHALRAHELKRNNPDFLNTLGVAYGEAGQLDLAEAAFRKLLKRKPGFVDALVNLGKSLEKQERLDEARQYYERALAIQPAFPKLAVNLATAYSKRGDIDGAKAVLDRCARHIDAQDLCVALARWQIDAGDAERGLEWLRRAVADHPDWKLARSMLAYTLLCSAQWREGWSEHARRRDLLDAQPTQPPPPLPRRLEGRTLLLRGEEGIGDVLFFLRFAPLVRERGARLVLACERKLRSVLRSNAILDEVRSADDPAGSDHAAWTGDLPAVLDTDATPPAWRLELDADAMRAAKDRLAALGPAPYLAVTWRAGTDTARGREFGAERISLTKSVAPQELGAALRGWRGTTILLQRGARPEDAKDFAAGFGAPFHDLSALGDDLRTLLAVLSLVDEYVGVSNTNIHLLAGIDRSGRVIVPYPPEWRWLREDRSPWFPDFPVYRQPVSRDWSAPLAALRKDLGLA
jgi:tetratricopeptide (TPR) repeat protein